MLGSFIAVSWFTPAPAQLPTLSDVAKFSGSNRMVRLVEGAKREGAVSVYAANGSVPALANAFTAKYGIPVRLWESSAENILLRLTAEAQNGRYSVDVVDIAGPQIEALNRASMLQRVESPRYAELMPGSAASGRPWVASHLLIVTGIYNTRALAKADLPRSYEDLRNPRWKGKLGFEVSDSDWFMTIATERGARGVPLFREIVARNGASLRSGHGLLANLVAAGEVPLGLNVYLHQVDALKRQGAPVEALFLPSVVAIPSGTAVTKRAPHPFAAVLFFDYLLSEEGQKILAANNATPTNLKAQSLPDALDVTFLDVPKYLSESTEWDRTYKDVLATRPQ